MAAWQRLFDGCFAEYGLGPAYGDRDYFELVDGRPRYDGVDAVLRSRGLELPSGAAGDDKQAGTVCGLGNWKNVIFEQRLAADGVSAYPEVAPALDELRRSGKLLAVVSSSANAAEVLELAGLAGYFAQVVDGVAAARQQLPGKPAPDTFLRAARLLNVRPDSAVIVEDAISGVAAGRAGGFGLVVGVDRGAVGAAALLSAGADAVVRGLDELVGGADE
jgi:HAD superfamily hydrolase (TIGR01509 family)